MYIAMYFVLIVAFATTAIQAHNHREGKHCEDRIIHRCINYLRNQRKTCDLLDGEELLIYGYSYQQLRSSFPEGDFLDACRNTEEFVNDLPNRKKEKLMWLASGLDYVAQILINLDWEANWNFIKEKINSCTVEYVEDYLGNLTLSCSDLSNELNAFDFQEFKYEFDNLPEDEAQAKVQQYIDNIEEILENFTDLDINIRGNSDDLENKFRRALNEIAATLQCEEMDFLINEFKEYLNRFRNELESCTYESVNAIWKDVEPWIDNCSTYKKKYALYVYSTMFSQTADMLRELCLP